MKCHLKKMYWQTVWPLMKKKTVHNPRFLPGYNYEKTFRELFTFSRHRFSGSRRQSVCMLPWVDTLVAGQIIGQRWCSHKHCQSAAASMMSTSMFHHLMRSRGVKHWLEHNSSLVTQNGLFNHLASLKENKPLSLLHIILHGPLGSLCWKGARLDFFFCPFLAKGNVCQFRDVSCVPHSCTKWER